MIITIIYFILRFKIQLITSKAIKRRCESVHQFESIFHSSLIQFKNRNVQFAWPYSIKGVAESHKSLRYKRAHFFVIQTKRNKQTTSLAYCAARHHPDSLVDCMKKLDDVLLLSIWEWMLRLYYFVQFGKSEVSLSLHAVIHLEFFTQISRINSILEHHIASNSVISHHL